MNGFGASAGALLTPALAGEVGWRAATAGWAVLAGIALLGWWAIGRDVARDAADGGSGAARKQRVSPLALVPRSSAVLLTLHFGALSGVTFGLMGWLPNIFHDHAGLSRGDADLLFAAVMVLGIPPSFLAPVVARRMRDQVVLTAVLAAAMAAGVGGLVLAPSAAPWLWAVLLGVGMGSVALALTMITMRAGGDPDVGAALSSLVQGVGYGIAGVVALLIGLVHSLTADWQWALVAVLGALAVQAATGLVAGRAVTLTAAGTASPTTAARA